MIDSIILNKKIVVVGAGGSGKDYLCEKFMDLGLKRGLLHTDRPQSRKSDVDGVTHRFISKHEFDVLISKNYLQEYESYIISLEDNIVYRYGITYEDYDIADFVTKTPITLKTILDQRDNLFIIYLNINEDIRRKRLSNRDGMLDSVERRLLADREDFLNFTTYDYMITEPQFNISDIISDLVKFNIFGQTEKNS